MNTFINSRYTRQIAMFLVLVMGLVAFVPKAEAGFVPTSLSSSADMRAQDMASVQTTLESKAVKERLVSLGYSQDEINARLGHVSNADLHSLASQLGALDAGGDGFGVVIVILVILLLGVLIYKLV